MHVEDGSLYLWESYTGDEPLLRDFSRAHVYVRDDGGEWVLDRLEGTLSVAHPAMNPVYLPLKTEYALL